MQLGSKRGVSSSLEIQRRIAFCPHCGNHSPQRLVFRHETEETGYDDKGNPEEAFPTEFFLALCATCDQPLLYYTGEDIEQYGSGDKSQSYQNSVLLWPTEKVLRHYGVVWEKRLTRSGMPKNASGWKWLRSQRVKSIVTFRIENDVDYSKYGFERVLRIPISGNPPADPPSDQQAEEFLRIIQDPNNAPVHMHCNAGRDRTGMMAALARYSIDGWPMEKALEEARSYRHGEDLPPKRMAWLYNWAAKHKAGSYRVKPDEKGAAASSARGRPEADAQTRLRAP